MNRKTLLVTLPPIIGGVPTKTKTLAQYLRRIGHDVTIAHYATLSDNPDLVSPSWKRFTGQRASVKKTTCFGDFPCISVGCANPEFEYPYYLPSDLWRGVINDFDHHIAVGGTVLVSNLVGSLGIKHMVWCASTMIDDRIDRRTAMPFLRQLFDKTIIGPKQRALECDVLARDNPFMAVSQYARDTLIDVGGQAENFSVVPVPVDHTVYKPGSPPKVGRIGTAGRASDSRKNIKLLIDATKILIDDGNDIELLLTGSPTPELGRYINDSGLSDNVEWTGWLDESALPDFYQSLDVFVFSSGKEGLGISGVQALASGTPVVSTRCGGPEDYVIDNETGYLVDHDGRDMADAIARIVSSRETRDRLSAHARQLAIERYSHARFEQSIADTWQKTWGDAP